MIPREIPWWKNSVGEAEARQAAAAIANAHVTMGPLTARLEEEIARALGVPYAVATPNGTAALVLAMMAVGVRPGDEVVVPNRTFIATAHAALLLGARVTLADVRTDLPLLDADALPEKLTPRTKAIVPTHLNGRAVDVQAVNRIAEQHGVMVVEDACQALFSRNADGLLGTQSHVGCFSLGITKLVASGFGGVAMTRDEHLYERMRLLRNQGLVDTLTCEYQLPGANFKCSDILAAVALVQLSQADEKIRRVREIYARYEEAIRDLPYLKMLPVNTSAGELPLYAEAICPRRAELVRFLEAEGIQTRKLPPDLSQAPYLTPAAPLRKTVFADQGLVLPCGPDQPLENVDFVIDALRRFENAAGEGKGGLSLYESPGVGPSQPATIS